MNTKYKIDEVVFVCYFNENTQEHCIFKAVIQEILLSKDGLTYYVDNVFEEYNENEIFKNLDEVKKYLEGCYYE